MKRDLRIVFMGTPDFAVATLAALINNNYKVLGVITAPDKPAGRGRKLNESAVKKYAKEKGLTILQPTNLKDPDFNASLKSLQANLQIVVAFRMLPKMVWQMPEYGTFNLHASLLPQYRGAAPINWAIINGENKTGVSTFFIDEKIDTGAIILQKPLAIAPNDNAGVLHDKLMHLGSSLVIDTVKLIEGANVITTPQPSPITTKTAYKLNKDNCKIDWSANPEDIYNLIRGLSPYPAAWCNIINDKDILNVKIYDAIFVKAPHDMKFGSLIITKNEIKVAVKNGYLSLLDLKLPGKRRMDVKSLLNGFQFEKNCEMR
ncbi:MAG: methionyl-tRNA formyltransferase [Flavobacteriaceae bacterium]|nr:methionyl-tRNA formyltransferase [Flavobacteriaceae bacterium]